MINGVKFGYVRFIPYFCFMETDKWEVYKLTNPKDQVGLPNYLKWAVAKNGGFQWAYPTKKRAKEVVESSKQYNGNYKGS